MIELELFVSGQSVNSVTMIRQVNKVTELMREQNIVVTLSIVDVLDHPERALDVGVMLTPVLIRWKPSEPKMLIGLANEEEILSLVNLVLH
jgi:hypothetical protein